VSFVGIILGVPLGVALGRAVWHEFAIRLGVVPADVVSMTAMLLLIAGVVIAAVVLSLVPSILSARVHPAEALREAG
jgi:ABC-type antimicrobial peptide transport system permease subunit